MLRRVLISLVIPVLGTTASAQIADDPTAVPQLVIEPVSPDRATDTEQLNLDEKLQLQSTEVDQLSAPASDVGISQAEGGVDLCATSARNDYEVCNKSAAREYQAQRSGSSASPEEDYIAGSPLSIDRFSRDPNVTADQIGRGHVASLAAQSFANELLNTPWEKDVPAESLLPQNLPPDVLQIFESGAPVPPEGS